MTIETYKALDMQRGARTCTEHKDQPFTGACKVCLKLVCTQCAGSCADGEYMLVICVAILGDAAYSTV